MTRKVTIPDSVKPGAAVTGPVDEFVDRFKIAEIDQCASLLLHFDIKSGAYYLQCHLEGDALVNNADLEASIDGGDEDEIYKLNRDITEDDGAYRIMEKDANEGRSFEDLVIEFDTSYHQEKPFKVYGGQHRIRAIQKSLETRGKVFHGARIYFGLTRDQKVEIATVNNTSIAVPNDLLDRMREQLIGSELRDWCQSVGLLDTGQDFADRKSPDSPTVRIARTLIVNYFKGRSAKITDFHQPVLCKSGGMDDEYLNCRATVEWNAPELIDMGRQFARLHKAQREIVAKRNEDNNAEFARKALSLTVVASWAYAAGLFQAEPDYLKHLYSLPDSVANNEDPLNAKALSQARLKGVDPDTYRGLGARTGPAELGRMLEVFIVMAEKAKQKRITKDLANAAIKSYQAKRAQMEAQKDLGRI